MYRAFFKLRHNPFNVNPDPRFLYCTRATVKALASLAHGIYRRKGFILLSGEVGTGKTTIVNKLLEWLRTQNATTAFIFHPSLDPAQFLDMVLADFGVRCDSPLKSQKILHLHKFLLERHRAGGTAVLIVDEAQDLAPEVLEEIRLLTNLETSTHKLLQILLSGQPELEELLRRPEMRQVRQRITIRCKTYPLTLEETQAYILTRLKVAGATMEPIFAPDAVRAIHRYSQGIPRIINFLCEHALIAAFADQQRTIRGTLIDGIAHENELDDPKLGYPQAVTPATEEMSSGLGENSADAEQPRARAAGGMTTDPR
ncbi:MAG: ExeA family protein [Candidatus Korobacteraceae bacterium]